jgi:hypothetical protein
VERVLQLEVVAEAREPTKAPNIATTEVLRKCTVPVRLIGPVFSAECGDVRVGEFVQKTLKVLRNMIGTAGLVFAGCVFLESIPALLHYIRISTM